MPANLTAFLLVGAGGAGGAIARYGLTLLTARFGPGLPLGTLLSNLLGCLVMGGLAEFLLRVASPLDAGLDHHHRLLFGVGFCGAFTTLSALIFELSAYLQRAQLALAFSYLMLTLLGGFACFAAGAWLVRTFAAPAG